MTKHDHDEPPRQALRASTTRERYRDPLVVFVVVLVAFLGFYRIYHPSATISSPSSHDNDVDVQVVEAYNEDQLQEVATLMDELYTILADTSFIPHDSIKRGPHQINSTASPCRRDPADLRLMEILPYVETTLLDDDSWLWGGTFVDYRKDKFLRYGCDPSEADEDPSYLMRPGTVHLTNGGRDGWDLYRSWKLQYDTRKNAIRVYEGEEWIAYQPQVNGCLFQFRDPYRNEKYRSGRKWKDTPVFEGSNSTGSLLVNRHSRGWTRWTDAPTFLRRIRDAYRSTAWTPWVAANPADRRVLQPSHNITSSLLIRNGWPEKLDIDQFRADFIRARHKPSARGWAEGAFQHIKTHQDDPDDPFNIYYHKRALQRRQGHEFFGATEKYTGDLSSGGALWSMMMEAERVKNKIDQHDKDYEEGKRQIQRLCTDGICVEEEDLILWEFRELEKTHTKAQLEHDTKTLCERRALELERFHDKHLSSDQHASCVTQLNLERHWLELAYQQSRADAIAQCARSNKDLLPPASFETLASIRIADYESSIASYDSIPALIDAWQERNKAPESTIETLYENYHSAKAHDARYYGSRIEEIKKALSGDIGDEALLELWNRLELPEKPRSESYERLFY
ncbi:hypothetical protein J4E91_005122 [Alternaria rosae]|nr:hypothetical protein J4E91_005122 [Alternaria rosae]